MSIMRAMNTGAAGIRAHGDALGVVGDNIANVNTVGFKRQRGAFEDILGRSVAGSSSMPQAGAGSRLAHIEQMWNQGALLTTESPTDLALSGNGTFVVEGNVGGVDGRFYARAGQFHVDANGLLVNNNGMRLQGYGVDDTGQIGSTVGDILVEGATLPARATTTADISMALDSNRPIDTGVFDPTNPSGYPISQTIYDSLGNAHDATTYFRKTADNAWEWHSVVDGAEITGGTPGVPSEGASGTLTFTTDGALASETPGASLWNFTGGATAGQTVAFNFGTSIAEGGAGFDATTQTAQDMALVAKSQDGFSAGSVAGVSVGTDGTVLGVFSNGQRRALGQVVVADFASMEGLARAGQGLWAESQESGEALIGTAESGGRGSVVSGALEQSNVDLSREFVDLIAYQRGFQANSRIITTADEMYTELVNLKR